MHSRIRGFSKGVYDFWTWAGLKKAFHPFLYQNIRILLNVYDTRAGQSKKLFFENQKSRTRILENQNYIGILVLDSGLKQCWFPNSECKHKIALFNQVQIWKTCCACLGSPPTIFFKMCIVCVSGWR